MKHLFNYFIIIFLILFLNGKGYSQASEFGVNLSGMEWGNTIPGTEGSDYFVPTAAEFAYYNSLGLKLFRIPFLWERMQPTLGGPLNATYLAYLDQVVAAAAASGVSVYIDCHNYARYNLTNPSSSSSSNDTTTVITHSKGPTQAQYNNLWTQLATHYATNATVWGYDIMNEPHNLGKANWPAIVQSVVNAIRTVDTIHVIIVEGDNWSQGYRWPTLPNSAGLAAVIDPTNNLLFEAHQYFDSNESGTFTGTAGTGFADNTPLDTPNTVNSGVNIITPFVNWINKNNLRGMVGEFGIPNNATASDQANWNTFLGNFLAYLRANCILGTYWAGGPAWGNSYVLSCEPLNNDYTNPGEARPQMPTLASYTSFETGCTSVGLTPALITDSIISPATNTNIAQGVNITLTASAGTTFGSITKVVFYQGTTLLVSDTASPYTVTWKSSDTGSYRITAVATNSILQTSDSSAITINVGTPPASQTITGPTSVTSNQQGVIYSVPDTTGATYQWTLPVGATVTSSSSNNSQITVNFGSKGGTVSVTETNPYGSSISSLKVKITTVTGLVTPLVADSYLARPNPFINTVILHVNTASSSPEPLTLIISDLKGVNYYSSSAYFTNEDITVGEQLPSGVYIAQLVYANQIQVVKLVKIQ